MKLSTFVFALTSAAGALALNAFTSPVGRQSLTAGEPFVIRWNNVNGGSKVDLFLKRGDSGNLETALDIATDLDNVGAVRWTLPADIQPGDYALEIVNKDNLGDVNYTPMFVIAGAAPADPPTTTEAATTTSSTSTTAVTTTKEITTTEAITTTVTAATVITRNETVTVITTTPNMTLPVTTPSMNVTTFPNTTVTASPTFTNTTVITTATATTTFATTTAAIVGSATATSYSSLLLAGAIAVIAFIAM
ncbi:hypothetical protein D0Z00_003309 [Geotrichum galactomycetum]|uniref:Uncharacterized protein n=1 Tax=Geotrichum galactomycetum TaxID=27317 RepID=A0ACB6V1L5_9ASCO|nr:hypothetical protein D0Z00_003309 [Geotrichum candidum]